MGTRIALANACTLACVALAAAGCGGGDDEPGRGEAEGEALSVELAEENGSGQLGTATLTPEGEDKTRIVVELSNAPADSQPAHVHPGPCGDLGDPIAGLVNLEGGTSTTVVDMSLADLQRGGLVVHAHKSEAEFDVSVACGEIPEA